jgi:hypothetical protein
MEKRAQNTNKVDRIATYPSGIRIWRLLAGILILLLAVACQPTETVVVETPDTQPTVTDQPTGEPAVIPCEGADGNYTCPGVDGHTITFSGVPADVTPALLEVSESRKTELLDAPRQDTSCVFVIAGDVVFYDQDNNLIEEPNFSEPVTIMFDFNEKDIEQFEQCTASITVQEGTTIQQVPVYYHKDVWRPFKEGSYVVSDNTVTIEFKTWGDQPIGGGTQP